MPMCTENRRTWCEHCAFPDSFWWFHIPSLSLLRVGEHVLKFSANICRLFFQQTGVRVGRQEEMIRIIILQVNCTRSKARGGLSATLSWHVSWLRRVLPASLSQWPPLFLVWGTSLIFCIALITNSLICFGKEHTSPADAGCGWH